MRLQEDHGRPAHEHRMLTLVIQVATAAHAAQVDKANMPYILHPLAVMHLLRTNDLELAAIAVGHDLFEDTAVSASTLRDELGIPERVIAGIEALTKRKGEPLEAYLARVKANRDATLVKLAVLTHNSDLSRIPNPADADLARQDKYRRIYQELDEHRVRMGW